MNTKRFQIIHNEDGTQTIIDTQIPARTLKAQEEHERGRSKTTYTNVDRAIREEKAVIALERAEGSPYDPRFEDCAEEE